MAVGVILVILILQLVIMGAVVAGARDQDLRIHRLDAVRSQYAADAAAQMSLREVFTGVDADGDGAIGRIAGGVPANGPRVNGGRGAASLAVTGRTSTLMARGTAGACARVASLAVQDTPSTLAPMAAYAPSAAPAAGAVAEFSAGAWGAPLPVSPVSGDVWWQVLVSGPAGAASPGRALLSLALDRSLWISRFSSGAWGAPVTLTADAGTPNARVFAAEYEGRTGNLMVAYRSGASSSIYYRTYSSATPVERSLSLDLPAAPTWMELVGKAGSNEMLLLVASGPRLAAAVWDGTAWGNAATLEGSLPTAGRPFHAAYLAQSGAALVVWTGSTGSPRYAIWSGTAWSSPGTMPPIAGGAAAGWVKVAASPSKSGNEALALIIGVDNQINVNRWDGGSWGSNTVVETSAAANTRPRADVCYQADGALGLLVWHRRGQNALLYRTWNGAGWSSPATGPDMGTETNTVRLVRGSGDTEIMMLVRRDGPLAYDNYNVYSQNGIVDVGTTVINGPVGTGGVLLPSPPSATAGATNLAPASGTVIPPGAYGSLTVGNNTTIGFSTGTYVFSSILLGNQTSMNFDTTAGPVRLILTSGSLVGSNNNSFNNTGGAGVQIHVLAGGVDLTNGASFGFFDILVYNGPATFKNSSMGAVNIWASGDITLKNNGTIDVNGLTSWGTPPRLTSVLWTAGVPGPAAELCGSLVATGVGDPCALAGNPLPSRSTLESWAAVAP